MAAPGPSGPTEGGADDRVEHADAGVGVGYLENQDSLAHNRRVGYGAEQQVVRSGLGLLVSWNPLPCALAGLAPHP